MAAIAISNAHVSPGVQINKCTSTLEKNNGLPEQAT